MKSLLIIGVIILLLMAVGVLGGVLGTSKANKDASPTPTDTIIDLLILDQC